MTELETPQSWLWEVLYLGRDPGVLQQNAGPHSRVSGHKLPVPADLGGAQERLGVQVGEDAEKGGSHLEHLRADHLVGLGRAALVMAARLAAALRTPWDESGRVTGRIARLPHTSLTEPELRS